MEKSIDRVVVVGGGTAGWLTASYIAARLPSVAGRSVEVTLIEAPDIATVGVGEGTWPTMRATLAEIGLDEAEVLKACDGSFKQGSRFDGWVTGASDDIYYHPFTPPPDGSAADLVAAWREITPDVPFAFAVSAQPAICQASLAPRQSSMPAFAAALNYAYHLDATKLARLLSSHAVGRLGVTHLRDEVVEVQSDDSDGIRSLRTRSGVDVEGDLFIDCSGHAALLIGRHCGSEWIDLTPLFANDRALAAQVPTQADAPISSQTIGTAHEAGWIWDIALPARRGIGCVYSSSFVDDERADAVLRKYVRRTVGEAEAAAVAPRILSFRSGHRSDFWRGNCLAIGLSAGFVEPLEASAIVMIELSLRALVENFPATSASLPLHAERFNALFRIRWERIVEFLKLHYVLSRRQEPYWLAQRDPANMPPRLVDLLELWRDQPPSAYDFPLAEEIFPAASYQYVYYGMGGALPRHLPKAAAGMRRAMDQVRQRTRNLSMALPTNRAILNSLAAGLPCDKVAIA